MTIGNSAIIAAGTIVTKNVNEFEIVGSVLAKAIGNRKNLNLLKENL